MMRCCFPAGIVWLACLYKVQPGSSKDGRGVGILSRSLAKVSGPLDDFISRTCG